MDERIVLNSELRRLEEKEYALRRAYQRICQDIDNVEYNAALEMHRCNDMLEEAGYDPELLKILQERSEIIASMKRDAKNKFEEIEFEYNRETARILRESDRIQLSLCSNVGGGFF